MSRSRDKENRNIAIVLKFIGSNVPFKLFNLEDLRELLMWIIPIST